MTGWKPRTLVRGGGHLYLTVSFENGIIWESEAPFILTRRR